MMCLTCRHGIKCIEMHLNTNTVEGFKYIYKYLKKKEVFKYKYTEKYLKCFSNTFYFHDILICR